MSKPSIRRTLSATLAVALGLAACAGPATPAPTTGDEKVTLTVWDYYGEATPLKPLIEGFQKDNPNITIQYEALDWDTTLEKLNVVLTGGTPPDVVTADMTWLPKFAALGAFADLKTLSGGKLNGVAFDQAYTPGALEAITFNDKIVAALYDFDVYALYYRADLFKAKGIEVPKTWDDLVAAAHKLAEGDKYLYQYQPDTFHGAQWIYENGGSLMNADNSAATFNSPEAVAAIQFYADLLLKEKVAIYWGTDEGDRMQGIKDGRIAMFSDGPYYMGILKSGAPEMAGQWAVAPHPTNNVPGSYLGGTGLVVPASSAHQAAAWAFIEYAMRAENQVGVYKNAGAAPALTAALDSTEVNVADPYFGDEKAFSVFLDTMKTAHHFPYVRQWADIDTAFTTAMQEIGLGTKSVQQALDDAVAASNDALKK